jgi:CheY-like chemotaxis protein
MKPNNPILLVDDNMEDATTVSRALQDIDIRNKVVHVKNGLEALEYLQNPLNQKPKIILLDINMPKMNGVEFLRVRMKDDSLKVIPVIVLSTSDGDKDKSETFKMNIAGYMLKPVSHSQFIDVVKAIDLYWSLSETTLSE